MTQVTVKGELRELSLSMRLENLVAGKRRSRIYSNCEYKYLLDLLDEVDRLETRYATLKAKKEKDGNS